MTRLVVRYLPPLRKGPDATVQKWEQQGYVFEFRKGTVLGTLTITGPDLAMPYNVLCKNALDARRRAREVVAQLRKGQVPKRGVYRLGELPPLRRRSSYGGQPVQ